MKEGCKVSWVIFVFREPLNTYMLCALALALLTEQVAMLPAVSVAPSEPRGTIQVDRR